MKTTGFILAALVLATSAPASATGNVRIQQSDGTIKTYAGVVMKVGDKQLTLTSADGVSTVVIGGADCGPSGALVRCTGGGFTFQQDGQTHTVPFKTATFYFNPTERDQPLPLSTTKVPPHSVLFAITTAKGTDITGSGKLDQEPIR